MEIPEITLLIAERHRSVEALAQALYEASDPAGVGWARRSRIVRDAWLMRAEREIPATGTDQPPAIPAACDR